MTASDNGNVTYSNQLDDDKYIFGTVATYTCSHGYGLSSTESRTCITDNGGGGAIGRFSGNEPNCDRELILLINLTINSCIVHRYHVFCSPKHYKWVHQLP